MPASWLDLANMSPAQVRSWGWGLLGEWEERKDTGLSACLASVQSPIFEKVIPWESLTLSVA